MKTFKNKLLNCADNSMVTEKDIENMQKQILI